jgi:hypothetical protein
VDHREIHGIFIGNVDGIYEIHGINGIYNLIHKW